MEAEKPAIGSRSLWAGVFALVAWLVNLAGYQFSAQEQQLATEATINLVHVATDAIGIVSTAVAMYYRVVATHKVSGVLRTPS